MNLSGKYRNTLLFLALLGIVFSLYLTYLHYASALGLKEAIPCSVSETFNCDIVNTSVYSEIFGIPISFLGALSYLFIIIIAVSFRTAKDEHSMARNKALLILTSFMILFTVYLFSVSKFILGVFCLFCVLTYFVNLGLFGTILLHRRRNKHRYSSFNEILQDKFIIKVVSYLLFLVLIFLIITLI